MQDAADWSEEEGAPPAPQQSALLHTTRGAREVGGVHVAGPWLAAGEGRALRTWRWARGEGWREHAEDKRAHRMALRAVQWAPAGALLASGGVEGAVRLWSRSLAPRGELAAPGAGGVRALCWAGGGRLLAAHDCGALCVWGGARLQARLLAHGGGLYALAAPAGGALLLSGCGEGTVKLHDMEAVVRAGVDGQPPPPLGCVDSAHDLGVLCAAARPGGPRGGPGGGLVATGGQDARVRLWRGGRGGLRAAGRLAGHGGAVTALAWAGNRLVSTASDGIARVWVRGVCVLELRAHTRYCTAVAADPRLRFIVTGSSDRFIRTWSLGALTLDDDLEPPCAALEHFALGDLEGIGAVEAGEPQRVQEEARCVWSDEGVDAESEACHSGAINCITAHGDRIATACSDGMVRIFRWQPTEPPSDAGEGAMILERVLQAHDYPATAVDWGADGALLLTAGLDGRARLWDPDTGAELLALGAGAAGAAGDAAGMRAARLAAGVAGAGPARVLLAADDGASLWSLAGPAAEPTHVYGGHVEGALCCGWAPRGALLAVGGAAGELRLHAPPPRARLLHLESDAHDLGVQSLDWLSSASILELDDDEGFYLLVTGGSDGYIKMWVVQFREDDEVASVRLAWRAWAHEGGVAVVRAARGGPLLLSGGADRWARLWRPGGGPLRALPAPGRQLPALALLQPDGAEEQAEGWLLALGSLDGRLAVWRLGIPPAPPPLAGPRGWEPGGVRGWLRDHVLRGGEPGGDLLARAGGRGVTGARLLDDPLDELMQTLCGDDQGSEEDSEEDKGGLCARAGLRARLREELRWLRAPPPPRHVSEAAPHALLCPLTHSLLARPVRAPDGFSYEEGSLLEWLQAEGAVSPVSGRPLHSARAEPNHQLTLTLRQFLLEHGAGPPDEETALLI